MPKTISWTDEFKEEILGEEVNSLKLAIRPGRLYHDTSYYKKGDIVDIRVNNVVLRSAIIDQDLRVAKIADVNQSDINLLKSSIQDKNSLIKFLSEKYDLCINENSEVTLVTYRNLELGEDSQNEDPHFS